jgi:hypothetical protein
MAPVVRQIATPLIPSLSGGVAIGLAAVCGTQAAPLRPGTKAPPAAPLHVPSPDWRDQIIYFVLTDRFADGDPSNNDQGAGEYNAGQPPATTAVTCAA